MMRLQSLKNYEVRLIARDNSVSMRSYYIERTDLQMEVAADNLLSANPTVKRVDVYEVGTLEPCIRVGRGRRY